MKNIEDVLLKPCDIFFTHGESFISKSIRYFEAPFGHAAEKVNHVGIVVKEGTIKNAQVVEALTKVKKHTLYEQYHNAKDQVIIYRPLDLREFEKRLIIAKALKYVGDDYGYLKIVMHLLDYFTGKHYFFRRFAKSDNYPICSWVVSFSYKAVRRYFDCDPGMAAPSDIYNFCVNNPYKYSCVLDFTRI